MKLTKKTVENLPLPESGQVLIWDSEQKGFGLRLTPSGRMYIIQGRVGRVSRRVSLGKHGVITLQEARKKAQRELSAMNEGVDPAIEKKRAVAYSLTLKELAQKYIKDRKDLKPSSQADIQKHIKTSFSAWADRPAVEVTRDKVATRFQELTERSKAQANQAFRILRALLNYARAAYRPDDKPLMIENPVRILSDAKLWNRVKARSGRIPTDKIGAAWNTLQKLRADQGQSIIGRTLADIITFLLLTGARWTEAANLTWEHVNLDGKYWHIPDPKNRNPVTLPLSQPAVDILRDRPQSGAFVFPGRSGGRVVDARSVLDKVSKAAGVRISAHDLRRTFRAIAGECQLELWKAKLLMNHRLNQDVTIGHYTETEDLRYLEKEVNKISDWILRQGVIARSEKVVPFPRKAIKGSVE